MEIRKEDFIQICKLCYEAGDKVGYEDGCAGCGDELTLEEAEYLENKKIREILEMFNIEVGE